MIGINPLESSFNEDDNNENNSNDISVSIDTMNEKSTPITRSRSKSLKRKLENSDQSEIVYVSSSSNIDRSSIILENDYIPISKQVKSILLSYLKFLLTNYISFQKVLLAMRFKNLNEQDQRHPDAHVLQLVKSLQPSAKVSSDVSYLIHHFNLGISLICLYLVLR